MTPVEALLDILPQTQCRQCGFAGCRAYAEALAAGSAPPNRCAPGGQARATRLAERLGVPALPLDPEYGRELPLALARIRAHDCIGCGWCAKACPTDAVAGSPKRLYAIVERDCTGCALCLPACPMDAIELYEPGREWTQEDARRARARYENAQARRARREAERALRLEEKRGSFTRNLIADVLAKARTR